MSVFEAIKREHERKSGNRGVSGGREASTAGEREAHADLMSGYRSQGIGSRSNGRSDGNSDDNNNNSARVATQEPRGRRSAGDRGRRPSDK